MAPSTRVCVLTQTTLCSTSWPCAQHRLNQRLNHRLTQRLSLSFIYAQLAQKDAEIQALDARLEEKEEALSTRSFSPSLLMPPSISLQPLRATRIGTCIPHTCGHEHTWTHARTNANSNSTAKASSATLLEAARREVAELQIKSDELSVTVQVCVRAHGLVGCVVGWVRGLPVTWSAVSAQP